MSLIMDFLFALRPPGLDSFDSYRYGENGTSDALFGAKVRKNIFLCHMDGRLCCHTRSDGADRDHFHSPAAEDDSFPEGVRFPKERSLT
jgi:hypothetical protein